MGGFHSVRWMEAHCIQARILKEQKQIFLMLPVVCIECPIVLCHCYLGVFVIDRTVVWFVLLSIVLVIAFFEVISTVERLCSWGIWGSSFSTLWLSGCEIELFMMIISKQNS